MGEYENPEAKKAWAKEYIEKQKARNEKTNEILAAIGFEKERIEE
jgi:hypothetical protein